MEQKRDLDRLFDLLEQETSCYRQLILDLKKESECLRKGSTDALIQTVQGMDATRERILRLQPQIKETIGGILGISGKEPEEQTLSHLLSLLPPPSNRKLSAYQKSLLHLKEWAKQINDLNRSYIQDSLGYLREFISLLTHPVSEPAAYLQNGRRTPSACHSWSLNREV